MMASNPIQKSDIIAESAIESIIADFGKLNEKLKGTDEALKDVAKSVGAIANPDGSKSMSKLASQTEILEKSYKSQHQVQLDLIKIQKERQSAEQALQRQREKGIASMEREKIAQEKLNRPYNIASRELREMKNRYRDLAVQKSQGIRLTKDEAKEYRDLGRSIKDADANLKRIDKSVGDNFRNVGNYKGAISGLRGALGQLGLAFGGISLAKGAFETIKNFDESNADMAKTLNISTEAASKLSLEFTKMGSVTSIGGLQEMAVIGGQFDISADQITGFVASMDKANTALGSDFGGVEETAKQLGGLRNAFTDIKTSKIEDDLLGIGNALNELSSKGAKVDLVADFANRISAVAVPMDVASGEVLGLSATLAKLNVNAERGGTAVSTIFQRMTQDSSKFAEVAGVSTDEFTKLLNTDMVGAFKLVAKSFKGMDGDNVKMSTTLKALGLTGSGASEVFLKMSNNTELLDENIKLATKSLTEQDSILQEVEKKSSTVGASLEKVKNSYDAFILGVNDGTGAQNGVINFFDFIAKNLPTIISLVARMVVLWTSYKAIMKTMEIANQIKQFGGLKTAILDSAQAMKDGSKSANGFGTALKGIGFGIALQIFFELAKAFYDIATGADVARDAMARFDKQVGKSSERAQKKVNDLRETEKQLIAKYNEELEKRNVTQEQYNELVAKAKSTTDAELKNNIKIANNRKQGYKEQLSELENLIALRDKETDREKRSDLFMQTEKLATEIGKELNITGSKAYGFLETNASVSEVLNQLNANIGGTNASLKEYYGSLKESEDATKDFGVKTFDAGEGAKGMSSKVAKTKETIIDYTKAIRDLNAEMLEGSDDASTTYMRDSAKLANSYQDAIDKINSDEATTVIKKNEYLLALKKKYYKDLEEMGDAYTQGQIDKERQDIVDRIELQKTAFDMSTGRIETESRINALTEYNNKRDEIINNSILSDEEKQKQLEKLEESHQEEMLNIQLKALKERLANEIIIQEAIKAEVILGETSKEYEDAQTRILELQEQILNLGASKFKAKAENPLKKQLKKIADYFSNLMDAIQQKIDQVFAKLIESQNKTIENSKSVVSNLQAAANAGNLQASKSILAEEKVQEEAQKRIEKLQKRQQLTQMITGVLGSYSAKVANGDKNALVSTITEATVLSAFLKSLPSFDVGADRLQSNGKGIDNKGGFIAINHPDERIMTAEQNKMIGFNHKNSDIAKVMSYYNKGLLKPLSDINPMVIQQSDNGEILRSINDGFSKINNYNMSFEQLFSTFSLIIEKNKNGDSFKTKKTFKL